jgi:hypothetical protein
LVEAGFAEDEIVAAAGELEMAVEGQQITLSSARLQTRRGWLEAAQQMAAAGDDELILPDDFECNVICESSA